MRTAVHWMFAVVLLATVSCSVAHADMQLPEQQMPACPHHQPDDSEPEPQQCQDCIQIQFVAESRTPLESSVVPLLSPLAASIEIASQLAPAQESPAAVAEPSFSAHRILRV